MSRIKSNYGEPDPRVSLAGSILVASPAVSDGLFGRSVCIVLEHSEKQAVGVVLNKPLELDARVILDQLGPQEKSSVAAHINFGGPQSGPILAIHDDKELAEGGNELGVYLSAQVEHLKRIAARPEGKFRLYAGHALWGPSELDHQVIAGNWHVLPAIPDLVFDDETVMWPKAIRTVANQILSLATGLPVASISSTWN